MNPTEPTPTNPLVCMMLPMRGSGGDTEALANGILTKCTAGGLDIIPGACWTSLLPYTFNTLWAGSLNRAKDRPVRYVAMIHDDIIPDQDWLDTLIAELEAHDADMISAVVPIKDNRGLTSTAVDDTGTQWSCRRLALKEVYDLPETFGDEHVKGEILLNTGLWVARFDRSWARQTYTDEDGEERLRVSFKQRDRVIQINTGEFIAQTKPEDWAFSRSLRVMGCKLMATRKVGLVHERGEWTNRKVWGRWVTDLDCVPKELPEAAKEQTRQLELAVG